MDKLFARFAKATARATGAPLAFLMCLAAVLIWPVSGPVFRFSETWQLVINTGTTIITFLMVFLIQNTQNRDSAAVQDKLDALILSAYAGDRFIGIEGMTEKALQALHKEGARLAMAHTDTQARIRSEFDRRRRPPRPATPKPASRPRKPTPKAS